MTLFSKILPRGRQQQITLFSYLSLKFKPIFGSVTQFLSIFSVFDGRGKIKEAWEAQDWNKTPEREKSSVSKSQKFNKTTLTALKPGLMIGAMIDAIQNNGPFIAYLALMTRDGNS